MRPREKEFCRLTAVLGNPREAARRAGYKHPDEAWPSLIARGDVAEEIHKVAQDVSRVFKDTMLSVMHRVISADSADAVRLVYRNNVSDEEISRMNLSGVAEMKRTDKGVEIKFFDRIKALDRLYELSGDTDGEQYSGGLIEAMCLAARSLREHKREDDGDEL